MRADQNLKKVHNLQTNPGSNGPQWTNIIKGSEKRDEDWSR